MTYKQKRIIAAVSAFALYFGLMPAASAMHIMEGYLPVGFCVAWGVVCLPFLAAGLMSIRKVLNENRKALILLAMSGAFIFVISSLKIPSVTGSCSHMTGTGLGAILFWSRCGKCSGTDCSSVSGSFAGSRRLNYHRGKYFLYGGSRTFGFLRNL